MQNQNSNFVARVVRSLMILSRVFAVTLLLSGCASLLPPLEKPKVSMQQVEIGEATASDATLIFNCLIENPNDRSLSVDQVDYSLKLNGKPFATGKVDKGLSVAAKGQTVVPVPVRVRYADVIQSVFGFLGGGATGYQIDGRVSFGIFSIPFTKTGEVKLSNLR